VLGNYPGLDIRETWGTPAPALVGDRD